MQYSRGISPGAQGLYIMLPNPGARSTRGVALTGFIACTCSQSAGTFPEPTPRVSAWPFQRAPRAPSLCSRDQWGGRGSYKTQLQTGLGFYRVSPLQAAH